MVASLAGLAIAASGQCVANEGGFVIPDDDASRLINVTTADSEPVCRPSRSELPRSRALSSPRARGCALWAVLDL